MQGGTAATAGAVLVGAALLGPAVLLVAVAVLSVALTLGLLVLLDAPASLGGPGVVVLAVLAAAVVVVVGDGSVDGLAGVVALSLVAALVHQLTRRTRRVAVTESLADTMLAVVLVTAAACLSALAQRPDGGAVAVLALAAAASGLLVARLGDLVAARARAGAPGDPRPARPAARPGRRRGDRRGRRRALRGDDGRPGRAAGPVGRGSGGLRRPRRRPGGRRAARSAPGGPSRPRAAPVGVLLPYAVLGPVALGAGRLVLT